MGIYGFVNNTFSLHINVWATSCNDLPQKGVMFEGILRMESFGKFVSPFIGIGLCFAMILPDVCINYFPGIFTIKKLAESAAYYET